MERRTQKTGAGIILLEVLASLLIVGLSMALITSVHDKAIQVAHDSLQRGRAIWMVRNLLERVRVNINSAATYVTVVGTAGNSSFCLNRLTKCTTGKCNTTEIVTFDIEQVVCEANGLSNPRITLACAPTTCAEGSTITATVTWDALGGLEGPLTETQTITLEMMR